MTNTKEKKEVESLEKTLRYEVLQEVCTMTDVELNAKVDKLIEDIINGNLNEVDLCVAKATAKICAELRNRRSGEQL